MGHSLVHQGSSIITVTSVVEGTKTVIYYNVIPDRGFITLQKLTTNQQPTVSGLSPSSATVGGASFTLTVHGNNYVNGSTVRWNGSNRQTTFVSGSQLTATICSIRHFSRRNSKHHRSQSVRGHFKWDDL